MSGIIKNKTLSEKILEARNEACINWSRKQTVTGNGDFPSPLMIKLSPASA